MHDWIFTCLQIDFLTSFFLLFKHTFFIDSNGKCKNVRLGFELLIFFSELKSRCSSNIFSSRVELKKCLIQTSSDHNMWMCNLLHFFECPKLLENDQKWTKIDPKLTQKRNGINLKRNEMDYKVDLSMLKIDSKINQKWT